MNITDKMLYAEIKMKHLPNSNKTSFLSLNVPVFFFFFFFFFFHMYDSNHNLKSVVTLNKGVLLKTLM